MPPLSGYRVWGNRRDKPARCRISACVVVASLILAAFDWVCKGINQWLSVALQRSHNVRRSNTEFELSAFRLSSTPCRAAQESSRAVGLEAGEAA